MSEVKTFFIYLVPKVVNVIEQHIINHQKRMWRKTFTSICHPFSVFDLVSHLISDALYIVFIVNGPHVKTFPVAPAKPYDYVVTCYMFYLKHFIYPGGGLDFSSIHPPPAIT